MAGILGGNFNIGNALGALGGALQTFGAPPDQRAQVGAALSGNFQNMLENQRRQKERDFLLNLQISENARANQERAEAKAKEEQMAQAYKNLLEGQPQSANGFSQAQMGGAPTTGGILSQMAPDQRQFLQALPPDQGFGIIGQQLFKEDKNTQPSGVQEYQFAQSQGYQGSYLDYQKEKAAAGRAPVQPREPRQPGIITLYGPEGAPKSFYDTDPQISGLLQQGWTEAAPKSNSNGITITNPDGTVTQIGGNQKPISAADQATALRATMLDDAIAEFNTIDFDKVRTPMIIAADKSEGSPIMGAFVQTNMNEDEKKLLGNQGKIQEAVISAITGAAYTEAQKQNMRAAYVPLATDDPATRIRKLKDAAKFLKQMNSGIKRENTEPVMPEPTMDTEETIEIIRDPATGNLIRKQ